MYIYIYNVRHYRIFPHYLINSTIFGRKLPNIKCFFIFIRNVSHYINNSARYYHKCT